MGARLCVHLVIKVYSLELLTDVTIPTYCCQSCISQPVGALDRHQPSPPPANGTHPHIQHDLFYLSILLSAGIPRQMCYSSTPHGPHCTSIVALAGLTSNFCLSDLRFTADAREDSHKLAPNDTYTRIALAPRKRLLFLIK